MSKSTIPYFVVGSGRSGTRTIFKLLSGVPDIEAHHEYLCTHIQQVAALYFMGVLDTDEIKDAIESLHGAAIFYSTASRWVDCSNKLSWIIRPLHNLYPQARFVHLVRDGQKVASSYLHKLPDEMYDDASVQILSAWLTAGAQLADIPMPPPEKRYWWNIPRPGQPFGDEFPMFDQFQRCCYQWAESNRVILESLTTVPAEQQLFVKLENLVSQPEETRRFLDFFGIPFEDHFFEFLQTPRGVIYPMDFRLTARQREEFTAIAGPMMERLGYTDEEEYAVNYGDPNAV